MYEKLVTGLMKIAVDLPEKFSKNAENIQNLMDAVDALKKLVAFADYVADEVCVPDEIWEYNYLFFQEIACRKLVTLGIMKEQDGKYLHERKGEI